MGAVTIFPSEPGTGLRFRTAAGIHISAVADNVVDTARCTVLGDGTERISTVEHLLSACVGAGIDDALIDVSGPEIPIGDGSALCWANVFASVGVESAPTAKLPGPFRLREEIIVTGSGGSFIAAYPSAQLTITVAITFPHPLIGTQVARFSGADWASYPAEVAPARTFGFIEEVEALLAAGLARGGSLDNAIVIYPDRYSSPLRYENELARHKLLDVIGDLALAGCSKLPIADIIAVKPSHRLNVEMARHMLREYRLAPMYEG